MENWEMKTNNEIAIRLKEMEIEHQTIKNNIIKLYDLMEEMEKEYNNGNIELSKRLKRTVSNE